MSLWSDFWGRYNDAMGKRNDLYKGWADQLGGFWDGLTAPLKMIGYAVLIAGAIIIAIIIAVIYWLIKSGTAKDVSVAAINATAKVAPMAAMVV